MRPMQPAAMDEADSTCPMTWRRFAMALALLIIAAFPGVVLGMESFVFRDFGFYGYPLAHLFKESLKAGEWPLWNPWNNFGIPFMAQWSTMVLYPPSLIYLLLPLPWSLNLFDLAHLWFGGVGMFVLARRWGCSGWGGAVAGVVFSFNGISLNCLIWPHLTAALAWMPWVLLAAGRAWSAGGAWIPLAALAGAMQMLTGGPEFILLTWLIAAALCLARTRDFGRGAPSANSGPQDVQETSRSSDGRSAVWNGLAGDLLRLAVVVGCVAALAAAQLLPFLELTEHSHRSAQFSTGSWSMPGWGWANFLVPLFHCEPSSQGVAFQPGQLWTSSYYVSLGALALAAVAVGARASRGVWLLGLAAIVSVLFAMGHHGPLYGWLRRLVPGIGFFRYPIKCVAVASFALPLLAGLGLDALQAHAGRRKWIGLGAAGGILGAACAAVLLWASVRPELGAVWPATRFNGLMRLMFLALSLAAVAAGCLHRQGRVRWVATACVPFLLWLDVLGHVPWQNPTIPVAALQPGLKPMEPMPVLGEGRAMISAEANLTIYQRALPNVYTNFVCNRLALSCNTTLLDGLPVVDGFYSLYLKPSRQIHMLLYEKVDARHTVLMDFLGVQRVTAPGELFEFEKRARAMPLVTAGQQPVFVEGEDSFNRIQGASWDPRRTVFLPKHVEPVLGNRAAAAASVSSVRWRSHQVEFDCDAASPTIAVIAQAWYPAWTATVDGAPIQVLRANHAFQAVSVPAGRHHVVLRYEDRWFKRGIWISGLSALICAVWLAQGWKRRAPTVA